MARTGFIALIVGASLALLVLLQLVANIGLHEPSSSSHVNFVPLKDRSGTAAADDDSTFLLGVGKADITG